METDAHPGRAAVFLDRDGVLNRNVYYHDSGEWESPRTPADLTLYPAAVAAARLLAQAGFNLFIVTNQPSYAKGKTSLALLEDVQAAVLRDLAAAGASVTEAFMCLHHPDGIVPAVSFRCSCRKPSPFFLLGAARRHNIDLAVSWMIGDRDSDIECGQAAGVRTIRVAPDHPDTKPRCAAADLDVADMADAAKRILALSPPNILDPTQES